MKRYFLVLMVVVVVSYGLAGYPGLRDPEPASAHPTCGGTEGFYHDVCEAALACTSSGGTYSFPTCTYPPPPPPPPIHVILAIGTEIQ